MNRFFARSYWWYLSVVVALAALLRFTALRERGLLYWDEGKFALEGVRLLSVLESLPAVGTSSLAGKAIGTAKPTHALLIALSYRLFGVHDFSPLLLNATASALGVIILFVLARRMFNSRIALCAALFLAVSGYDIIYARSALSESDADLLFLVGVLLWWQSRDYQGPLWQRWSMYAGGGIVLGAAFTTNYRLIVYIVTLCGLDLFMVCRHRAWKQDIPRLVAWTSCLLLVPTLWQVIGTVAQAHGVVLFRSEITYRPTSYFSEVTYQLHGGRQSAIQFQPLPYLEWYVLRQGWLLSILLATGLAICATVRSFRLTTCAALLVVPYAVYTFAPFIVPRNLDAALPFTAILAAVGLMDGIVVWLPSHARRRSPVAIALLIAAICCVRAWSVTEVRSGFAQAAVYVEHQRDSGALAVNEVMRFYLRDPGRGCDAPRLPDTLSDVAIGNRSGNKYAVIDQYDRWVARYLARYARMVARYSAAGSSALGEDLIASENGVSPRSQVHGFVDVYALDTIHPHRIQARMKPYCTLDRLA